MVITVDNTHLENEIKLSENPFKKHCITLYRIIIKKKISNKLISLRCLKKLGINLAY